MPYLIAYKLELYINVRVIVVLESDKSMSEIFDRAPTTNLTAKKNLPGCLRKACSALC